MSTPTLGPLARPRLLGVLAVLLVGAGLATVSLPRSATAGRGTTGPAHDFGAPIWSGDLRGDVTTIGNTVTTCRSGAGADPLWRDDYVGTCDQVLAGTVGGPATYPANNELDLTYVDVDDDPTTHDSSAARLDLPPDAQVVWAGLHWHGLLTSVGAGGAAHPRWRPPEDPGARFTMVLRAPDGARTTVAADDRWEVDAHGVEGAGHRTYAAYADVTDAVRAGGAGLWTGAEVQTCTGPALALGCIGGWTLTVVHAAEDQPARTIDVWHGWDLAAVGRGGVLDVTASGLAPPPAGGEATLGLVAADGDRGRSPESVEHRTSTRPAWTELTTPNRPLHSDDPPEFFNSTIERLGDPLGRDDARPNPRANLNLDIAVVEGIPVSGEDTSFEFRLNTGTFRDSVYAQVVHSSIPLHEPEIAVTKTPSATVADPGQTVTWTFEVANVGIEPIRDARLVDVLPAELELVPGTVRYAAGGPPGILGPKTDAADDDQVRWDPATRELRLHVGAGATAKAGGTLGVDGAADRSSRLTITVDTIWRGDPGTVVTNEVVATGSGRELAEDPFGPITTEARDDAEVTGRLVPLLVQDKVVDEPEAAPGEERTYVVRAENRGGAPIPAGTSVTDRLPEGVTVVAASGEPTHDPERRMLTWRLHELPPGASWSAEVTVRVDAGVHGQVLVNRLLVTPPPEAGDPPIEVGHPCEDDERWSCAAIRTPEPPAPPTTTTPPTTPPPDEPPVEPPAEPPVRSSSPPRTPADLPRTGSDPLGFGLVGLGLLLGGAALVTTRWPAPRPR